MLYIGHQWAQCCSGDHRSALAPRAMAQLPHKGLGQRQGPRARGYQPPLQVHATAAGVCLFSASEGDTGAWTGALIQVLVKLGKPVEYARHGDGVKPASVIQSQLWNGYIVILKQQTC